MAPKLQSRSPNSARESKQARCVATSQKVADVFKRFDANGDGVISKAELKNVFLRLADAAGSRKSCSEQEVDYVMHFVDVNGDGQIDYQEFIDWVSAPGSGAEVFQRMQELKSSTALDDNFSDGGSTRAGTESVSTTSSLSGSVSARGPRGPRPKRRPAPFSHHKVDSSTPPAFFAGGFDSGSGRGGLQGVHDHSMAHGAAWAASEIEPPLQRAGKMASPVSHPSHNVVDRTGVFEGGRQRAMKRREVDGETLVEDTGVIALWQPKRAFGQRPRSTTLGHSRAPEFCARVEPDSRCFCGMTFIDHSASARLGCKDGFAWKRSLAQRTETNALSGSFGETSRSVGISCSLFRYMPSSPAQTTQMVSCADAYRAARGVPVESLHTEWYAPCRNCGYGHPEHDPETEVCPVPTGSKVGNGRYQSAWECTICNQRWEDHETVRVPECDYLENGARTRATSMRTSRNPHRAREPNRAAGGQWGSRAADVAQMLQENSYGISGKYKDSDHYGPGSRHLQSQIQRENAMLRDMENEIQQELTRSAGTVSYIDTSGAYKEGKGALYGYGVEDERQGHARARAQSDRSRFR